jgi:nicotinamide-nucleotide adenylyltransferase
MSTIGMVVGRFQIFHKGHEKVINEALKHCNTLLIFIGSSQESRTKRNPFTYWERLQMIRKVYPNGKRIVIAPLPDMTNELDITHEWGKYVLKHAIQIIGRKPDVIVYGNEESRQGWFAPEDVDGILEIKVPRPANAISATSIREYIKIGNPEWMFKVNKALLKDYEAFKKYIN